MKKYENRPSPSCSAADAPGFIAVGNTASDWLYESRPNKNNVYSWKKLTKIASRGESVVGRHEDTGLDKVEHWIVTEAGDRYVYTSGGNLCKRSE